MYKFKYNEIVRYYRVSYRFNLFCERRWWVTNHGCQNMQVPVSKALLDGSKQSIQKLRLILRFLLGILHPDHHSEHCEPQYKTIDKYMLYSLYCYYKKVAKHSANDFSKWTTKRKRKKLYHNFCITRCKSIMTITSTIMSVKLLCIL